MSAVAVVVTLLAIRTRSRLATIAAIILMATLPFVALRTHAARRRRHRSAGDVRRGRLPAVLDVPERAGCPRARCGRVPLTDSPRIKADRGVRLWPIGVPVCRLEPIRDSVMLYSTERDLMSDHDATQPPASGTPRPGQGDEFNARTVLINQELLDAARAESQQTAGQVPGSASGAVPGAHAQAGSWRPVQPDLPAGPPPEEQTRAYPAGAGAAAAQQASAPADPYAQGNPYAQQSGADPLGSQSPQPQPGQPTQFGQPDPAAGAGFGGSGASPFQTGQPPAQAAGQPAPYNNQPDQPAWRALQADDGAAAAASPFAQSAPVTPSAPGSASGQETLNWQDQQAPAQPAIPQDQQTFAQQPAPHSHPFSGGPPRR